MPPDTDRDLLIRSDERTEKIRTDQKEMKAGIDKINDRVRKVENKQSALQDRMKWISGIVSGAVAGVIGLFIKSST